MDSVFWGIIEGDIKREGEDIVDCFYFGMGRVWKEEGSGRLI